MNLPKKPIRILQIVYSLNCGGGVVNVVLNWHRNIDREKVQFDYLYVLDSSDTFEQEIKDLGGRVFCLNYSGITHFFSFLKNIYKFFKEHKYHTIHSHITNLNFFFYPFAKIFGTKNIIQHAHGTKWSDKKLNGWRNYLMLHAVWPFISHKLACSDLAGKFWYGKNYTVINNGIDVEKFDYKPLVRESKRKELGLENNFVIASIGRFNWQKNHKFLIEIFKEISIKDKTAKLVLIGQGPLEAEIRDLVVEKAIKDKVLFLGIRKDVSELYQAIDVICMPSFYEGLPVVGVEAQGAGVPCVFADTITKETILLPDSKMLSLKDSAKKWAEIILSLKNVKRCSGKKFLLEKDFDIKQVAKKIQDLYWEFKK